MKNLLKSNEFYLALLIAVIATGITVMNPSFLTGQNIYGFLKTASVDGIMAVGVLFVLILGGTPDVSFTAIAQVVQYVIVLALLRHGGDIYVALALATVMGAAMGALNGVMIHFFKVTTIVVTIATFNLYYGLLYVFSGGNVLYEVPPSFRAFGDYLLFPSQTATGVPYGLSLLPVMWFAVLIIGWFILNRTVLGRGIFAMGGNEVAAERIGVRTGPTRIFVFAFVGLLAGLAAVAHTALVQSAIPNSIVGRELEIIAAVVLGGASLFGGKGTIIGTALGILLFAIMRNGLVLLNISSYWYDVMIGVAIMIGISISAYQQIKARRARVNVKVEALNP